MTASLQHYLNPLHIYCRLRNMGLAKGVAVFLCRVYERAIFRYIVPQWRSRYRLPAFILAGLPTNLCCGV